MHRHGHRDDQIGRDQQRGEADERAERPRGLNVVEVATDRASRNSPSISAAESPVTAEVYEEMCRSYDAGVAEFLDLSYVKPNTLGNTRMLLTF